MKYKKIPNDYFPTILDRISRFEPAYIRYGRVVDDIINKFCHENNKNLFNIEDKIAISQHILNSSLKNNLYNDYLNNILFELENKYFLYNKLSYQYLSARFNFQQMLCEVNISNNLPLNVIWLKNVCNSNIDPAILRYENSLLFPIEKIILCEGQTEELLLENLCKIFGLDFKKSGIKVIAAGGKNQVARKYYQMIEYTKLPFFILLDRDAYKIEELIAPKLRKIDRLYLLKSGEFEDLFPKVVLFNALNSFHSNEFQCCIDDFDDNLSMVKNLENIYKKYGYGDFKKAEFAGLMADHIKTLNSDVFQSSEIINIVENIKEGLNSFTIV